MNFLKNLLLTALGFAIPCVAIEVGARILGTPTLSAQERVAILNEHQLNPDDAVQWCRPREAKAGMESRTKIFALGGSSVFSCCGMENGSEAFPAKLDHLLSDLKRYRVENYALSARDSFYHRDCVRLLSELGERPKFWIYYAGHNDFINGRVGFPYIPNFFQNYPLAFRFVNGVLEHSHLAGFLRHISLPQLKPLDQATFQKHKSVILGQYKKNLEATHQEIAAHGGQLILVTLVSNLETPPIIPFSPSTEQALNPTWLHQEGMRLKSERDFSAALAKLKMARDQDTSAWRAPKEVNEFLREFAAAHPETVTLLDMEKELDAFFPKEGISCNFFGYEKNCDYLHPNKRLHGLIAEKLNLLLRKIDQ